MPALRLDNTGAIDYISTAESITTTADDPNYIIVNNTASAMKVTMSTGAGAGVPMLTSFDPVTAADIAGQPGTAPVTIVNNFTGNTAVGATIDGMRRDGNSATTTARAQLLILSSAGASTGARNNRYLRTQHADALNLADADAFNATGLTDLDGNIATVRFGTSTVNWVVIGLATRALGATGTNVHGLIWVLPPTVQANLGNTVTNFLNLGQYTSAGGGGPVTPFFTTVVDKRSHFISGARPNAHTTVRDAIGTPAAVGTLSITSLEPLHTSDAFESVDDDDIDNVVYLLHATDPITFDNQGVGDVSSASVTTTTATPDFILVNNTASAIHMSIEDERVTVNKRSYVRSGPISNAHTSVNNTMNRLTVGATAVDSANAAHTGVIDSDSNNLYFLLAN